MIGEALDSVAAFLGGELAPPARQEARDLIALVLDVPRFWPTANKQRQLSDDEGARIDEAAQRFARGMPIEYAARRAAFRSLSLYVDERVLIPRPETEMLVDIVLDAEKRGSGTVIDVGTGSGCIALALASEGTFDRVIATDVSGDAIAVAQRNHALRAASAVPRGAKRDAVVEFLTGPYLAPVAGVRASVVVSNPPYISWDEKADLPASVRDWEPELALFAEDGGMAAIAEIATQAAPVLTPGGLLALEVDARRAELASEVVTRAGAYRDVLVRPDLTGRPRFVLARRAEE